jgi:mannose/fructose/sorbose-specific phosphotransferase system IIA component
MNLILATHFHLSSSLIQAAEMIAGPQEKVKTIAFMPDDGLESLKQNMEQAIKDLSGDLLVLTDLPGGSPCNAAMFLSRKYPLRILTGVNLPMLLEILMLRHHVSADELVQFSLSSGKDSIKEVTF